MQRRNDLVVIENSIKILVFMLPPPAILVKFKENLYARRAVNGRLETV